MGRAVISSAFQKKLVEDITLAAILISDHANRMRAGDDDEQNKTKKRKV